MKTKRKKIVAWVLFCEKRTARHDDHGYLAPWAYSRKTEALRSLVYFHRNLICGPHRIVKLEEKR